MNVTCIRIVAPPLINVDLRKPSVNGYIIRSECFRFQKHFQRVRRVFQLQIHLSEFLLIHEEVGSRDPRFFKCHLDRRNLICKCPLSSIDFNTLVVHLFGEKFVRRESYCFCVRRECCVVLLVLHESLPQRLAIAIRIRHQRYCLTTCNECLSSEGFRVKQLCQAVVVLGNPLFTSNHPMPCLNCLLATALAEVKFTEIFNIIQVIRCQ